MHPGVRFLRVNNAAFRDPDFVPTRIGLTFIQPRQLLTKLQKSQVVAVLGRPEFGVQLVQFLITLAVARIGVRFEAVGQHRKPFTTAQLDQRRHQQTVQQFLWLSADADQFSQGFGVGIGVVFGDRAAALLKEPNHLLEMLGLVQRNRGHDLDPVIRRVFDRVLIQEHQGVGGGLAFQVGMVVEQGNLVGQDPLAPRKGRMNL